MDTASFRFLRVITGLGIGAAPDARQRMLELEALQLTQWSAELERLLPDPGADAASLSATGRQRIVDALIATPGASAALRQALGEQPVSGGPTQVAMPAGLAVSDSRRLARAMNPPAPPPLARRLRVYAYDPLLGTQLETMELNEAVLKIPWEDLAPGPVGEYVEVVDVDPSSGCCYAPVDLNQAYPLSQNGHAPSEANPRFHQQMAYAVASKTIGMAQTRLRLAGADNTADEVAGMLEFFGAAGSGTTRDALEVVNGLSSAASRRPTDSRRQTC